MTRAKRPKYYESKDPDLIYRDKQIISSRMRGATITGLANGTGLSRTHVHRIVAGVPILQPRPKRPRKSRERPDRWLRFFDLKCKARALRKLGYSYHEIADRLGISHGCAFNAARMVKVFTELRGRAWLSHKEGRPRAWKRELLSNPDRHPARL
jgi:hypothetical protein